MVGLAQAGVLTVTASGASASLNLNGNGVVDAFVFSPTISADATNYNVKSAALAAGWNGTKKLTANITINSGVVVSANTTSIPAFDTGTGFPGGSTITLTNNGYIIGMGGAGGSFIGGPGSGGAGGPALKAQYAMTVSNTGTIGGGGGGGEGCINGGGGGRSGRTNSAGGYSDGTFGGLSGAGGTFSTAGLARPGYYNGGGAWGAAGGDESCSGSTPGAGGAAVIGNANITWTATGTRLGAIN
ncbi:hypothetical protein [Rhodoferax aquaticus]|uniref:hypothetical protein n=1 Tax=Rhodoferax aquaticus TaxID=2527691 RepID=UPI00143CE62A|nr:hypothetical protein [Rhodoferax aquaticus]